MNRKQLESTLKDYLIRQSMFEAWNPDVSIDDTGAYINVILSLDVPTGIFDDMGVPERVLFSAKRPLEKHVILVDSIVEDTVLEQIAGELIQDVFGQLGQHFYEVQSDIFSHAMNVIKLTSTVNVQSHAPKKMLLLKNST